MRKEVTQLRAELTTGSQTRREGFLRFLPCLVSTAAPHDGISSQNLKPNAVSKANSFDFATWEGGGEISVAFQDALGKLQSKWQFPFPSHELFWPKKKKSHVKSP